MSKFSLEHLVSMDAAPCGFIGRDIETKKISFREKR